MKISDLFNPSVPTNATKAIGIVGYSNLTIVKAYTKTNLPHDLQKEASSEEKVRVCRS